MSFTQLTLIAILSSKALTAPLPESSRYLAWNAGPSTRGTLSLLQSCIVTLVLCVYTAVHLNVPAPGTPKKAQHWNLAKWVCIGVFVPEVIVYAAIIQWMEARALTNEVIKIRDKKWIGKVPAWLSTWSLTQSFFVNMGGLSLPRDHPEKSTISGEKDLSVLTSEGFLYLLERQHKFPDLSKDIISDRGKAESFTKAISILQASWLIVEVLARVASHLAVTELEINTLAHVVGALLTYSFWFHKPLRIGHPLVIDGTELKAFRLANVLKNGACAHFMYNFLHQNCHAKKVTGQAIPEAAIEEPRIVVSPLEEVQSSLDSRESHTSIDNGAPESSHLERTASQQSARTIDFVLKVYDPDVPPVSNLTRTELEHGLPDYANTLYVQPTRIAPLDDIDAQERDYHSYGGGCAYRDLGYDEEVLVLNVEEMRHFLDLWNDPNRDAVLGLKLSSLSDQTCCESRWKVGVEKKYWQLLLQQAANRGAPLREDAGLTNRASNWHLPQVIASGPKLIAISFATVFYGAIHAAAWNSHFPSAAEMWVWRVSSILSTTFPLVTIGLFGLALGDMIFPGLGTFCIGGPFFLLAVIALPAYCFGRIYLVVEAFISLRSQPASAYEMPRWLSLIPHL